MNVTVTSINDAPVAAADAKTTAEDTALIFPWSDLTANDSPGPANESAQTLTVIAVSAASAQGGTVALTGGNITYTPAANFNGADSFTYTLQDNGSPVLTATGTVNVTVTSVNDAPVAAAQAVSVDEDASVAITLAGSDIDGDSLTFAAGSPAHGTLTGTAPQLTYTPAANYHGADSFTFTVNDGTVNSPATMVSITVNALDKFTQWLGGYGLATGPGDDSDGDSISNAIEYVIGSDPTKSTDLKLMPKLALASADLAGGAGYADYVVFSYRRTQVANADPGTTIRVEWSTSLAGPWSDASTTPGAVPRVDSDVGPGADQVRVYIPRSLAADGKLFVRLGVTITLP